MSGAICDLPNEVLLAIIAHLDIGGILAFRQTCRMIHDTTADKLIWLRHLEDQQTSIPLHTSIQDPRSDHVRGLSAQDLQSKVLLGHRTDRIWMLRRPAPPTSLRVAAAPNENLLGLELLQDRWLLAVYGQAIHLWDLDADDGPASLELHRQGLTSYSAMYDAPKERILIAVKKHSFVSPFATVLYEVSTQRPREFNLLCDIRTHSMHVPRCIDPTRNLIVSSHACLVELLDWTDEGGDTIQVPTEGETLEEMYTAINEIRIFGPYMIIFKTRSIELHPLPEEFQHKPHLRLPVVKHTFSNTFRSTVTSRLENPTCDLPISTTFALLASDLIQGLFHYTVHISVCSNDIPVLRVTLNGVQTFSNLCYRQFPAHPLTLQTADAPHYHQQSSVVSHSQYADSKPAGEVPMNKGFVSTYCIGEKGMRAVCVQRSREHMLREVFATRLYSEDLVVEKAYDVAPLDVEVVHAMRSVDLREDFIHCALGEASGKIALGNRGGEVFLLDID